MKGHLQAPKYIQTVYSMPRLVIALKAVSLLCVISSVSVFAVSSLLLLLDEVTRGIAYLVFTGVPFLGVSVLRARLSLARPYEIYDMPSGFSDSQRRGRSFPSRHVFSAFVIGVMSFLVSPILGGILLLLGASLGACRVLLGIHFVRDVVAGALIGVFFGVLGIIIVNYCL